MCSNDVSQSNSELDRNRDNECIHLQAQKEFSRGSTRDISPFQKFQIQRDASLTAAQNILNNYKNIAAMKRFKVYY